jgi:hypothetical protein
MSLVKTKIYCPEVWEGAKILMLPLYQEKQTFQIEAGWAKGLFVVRLRQDLHSPAEGGFVQRLRLRPWKGSAPPLEGDGS